MELTSAESAAALAEYDAVVAEPAPPDRGPVGCLTVVAALSILVSLPKAAEAVGMSRAAVLAVSAALLAVVVVGLVLRFTSGKAYVRAGSAADEALELLAEDDAGTGDVERARQAARLLANAYSSSGPTTVTTFDFGDAAQRLGSNLEYVVLVERVLLAEREIYPVFTLDEPDATDTA
jgi:hypothetical protein